MHAHRHSLSGRRDHRPAVQPSAQIGLFCMLQLMIAEQPTSVPNGGSRAAAVASDRDAVLRLFRRQSAWLLILRASGWL
jgi:hypothetical protein